MNTLISLFKKKKREEKKPDLKTYVKSFSVREKVDPEEFNAWAKYIHEEARKMKFAK